MAAKMVASIEGDINVRTTFRGNLSNDRWDSSLKNKFQPQGGARKKVMGSPKNVRTGIYQTATEIHCTAFVGG